MEMDKPKFSTYATETDLCQLKSKIHLIAELYCKYSIIWWEWLKLKKYCSSEIILKVIPSIDTTWDPAYSIRHRKSAVF
jgi:hypothetical protein